MQRLKQHWKGVHHSIRKPIVLMVGIVLIIASIATGWLPGPGGIPLFLLGIAVLATEFAWAERVKVKIMAVLQVIFAWFRAHKILGGIIIFLGLCSACTSLYLLYFR